MKTLNITLEDKEYEELEKLKAQKTWRQFLTELTKKEE